MPGGLEAVPHFCDRAQGFAIGGEQLAQMGQANEIFVSNLGQKRHNRANGLLTAGIHCMRSHKTASSL